VKTELKESKDSESKKDEARMTSKPAISSETNHSRSYCESLVDANTDNIYSNGFKRTCTQSIKVVYFVD